MMDGGGHEEKHEADEKYQVATRIEERARVTWNYNLRTRVDSNILFPIKIRVMIIRRRFRADKDNSSLINERLLYSIIVRPAQ
jgi:hypothetical protein